MVLVVSNWSDCSVLCSKELALVKEKKMLKVIFNRFTLWAVGVTVLVLKVLSIWEGTGTGFFANLRWVVVHWLAAHGF